MLGTADEFVAIHLRHDEVAKDKVDGARNRLFDKFQLLMRGGSGKDVVATSLKKEGPDGENLFVIVDAEDRFFRAQSILASAGRHRVGGLAADGLKQHVCWLAVCGP